MVDNIPILTHYCKRLEVLYSILENGFVTIPNSRGVLEYLIEPQYLNLIDGTEYYGMLCFTDIPPEQARDHRKKYGHYGIVPKSAWLQRNFVERVIYLSAEGELTSYFKQLFKLGINELQRSWFKIKSESQAEFRICISVFGNNNISHFSTISDDPEYGAIVMGAPTFQLACRFYAYLQTTKHNSEREWRIIQTTNRPYHEIQKIEKVQEALNAPKGGGWAPLLEKGFPSEVPRKIIIKPEDISCLILPKVRFCPDFMTLFLNKLPPQYRDVSVMLF